MPLNDDFWEGEDEDLLLVLGPEIEDAAGDGVDSAEEELNGFDVSFDSDLVNQQAIDWAQQHTDDLLSRLGTTNREVVGQAISDWLSAPGTTRGDLNAAIRDALNVNQSRADLIAVTEVTRAIAQGNLLSYADAGAEMPPNVDDGSGNDIPFGPTAHPGCRCDVAFMPYKGTWVAVWLTNQDDEVCKHPVDTPWGEVAGCEELHGVCISDGPYLGEQVLNE